MRVSDQVSVAFAVAAVMLLVCNTGNSVAAPTCEQTEALRQSILKQGPSGPYWGDLPTLEKRLKRDCSLFQNPSSDTPRTSNAPKPDNISTVVPASCAYFTRPAVEADGARLNYYAVGSNVCFNGYMYECVGVERVEKHWVRRAPCTSYQNWQERTAEKLEKSNSPP